MRHAGWKRARVRFAAAAVASMLALEPISGCISHSLIQRKTEIAALVSGHADEEDAMKALDSMEKYADRGTAVAVDSVPAHYQQAGRLARRLGMPDNASTRLNLAYGIAVLGEAGTARLHREMGIEYFMRYQRSMLLAALYGLDERSDRPLLVIGFNKSDYNGAFYREGLALGQLLRGYRVALFETSDEKGFYSMVNGIASARGPISALVIGGHGNPGAIVLGGSSEPDELDTSDAKEISALRKDFIPEPLVVLVSCSTGANDKAIGAVMSRALGARLYAPVKPSSRTIYHLDTAGRIASVSYDVQTRNFVEGVAR